MSRGKDGRIGILCMILVLCMMWGTPVLGAATATTPATEASKPATPENGWYTKGGKTYYYRAGKLLKGWQTIGKDKYYFNSKGVMLKGWQTISKKRYYFNRKGVMLKNFHTLSGKTYYFDSKGVMLKGWQTINKKRYYFDGKGVMKKGWHITGNKKYYFNNKGVMQTGLRTINKYVYLFDSKGVMQKGWRTVTNNNVKRKYYFCSKGHALVGFRTISRKKYYFASNGVMQTGFKTIGGKKYYFNASGVMLTGRQVIGNKVYYFNSNGVMDTSKTTSYTPLEKLCTQIVNKTVNNSDTVNQKIQKLFNYVTWNHDYVRSYGFNGAPGWHKTYAYNMLLYKGGNCYSYAAAFAYLVKKATDLPVRVGWGSTPAASGGLTPHGWCEVCIGGVWYVFDPDLYRYVYPGSCYYQTMGQIGYYYYNRNYAAVEF